LEALGVVMLIVHWFTAACICQLPETMGAHMGGAGGEMESSTNSQLATARSSDNDEDEVAVHEPDGIIEIDHDTGQHARGDEPIRHRIGPEIRILT
jgi:hypothetical protein